MIHRRQITLNIFVNLVSLDEVIFIYYFITFKIIILVVSIIYVQRL